MSVSKTQDNQQQVVIANVLPEGVYRRNVAPLGLDVVFPLMEPILAFGGLTSYFLLASAAYRKRFGAAAALAALQALSLSIGNTSEESVLLRRARDAYFTMARRAFPMMEFLATVSPHEGRTRPRILLMLPHGLFGIAAKRYYAEVTSTGRQPGCSFFVDDKLCALSPMMKASARMCGATKIYPVGDKYVRKAMDNAENCVVFPGGFIEATCTSKSCLRLYSGTYGYWVTRCIEYGYDIEVVLIYHGSEIWEQGEAFFDSRLAMAKKGMPGILPTFPARTPLAVREILYTPEQLKPGPDCAEAARHLSATILTDIVAAYSNDAARVFEITGKRLKRLEIIGKPLTGELPRGVKSPAKRTSLSRL